MHSRINNLWSSQKELENVVERKLSSGRGGGVWRRKQLKHLPGYSENIRDISILYWVFPVQEHYVATAYFCDKYIYISDIFKSTLLV